MAQQQAGDLVMQPHMGGYHGQGLTDITRHVINTFFQRSIYSSNGILSTYRGQGESMVPLDKNRVTR